MRRAQCQDEYGTGGQVRAVFGQFGQSRVVFDIYPDLGYNGRWLMASGLQSQLTADFLLYQRGEIEDEMDDGR